jgi:hypothetical protein
MGNTAKEDSLTASDIALRLARRESVRHRIQPTSGPYLGVLFLSGQIVHPERGLTGGASMQLTGSLYFPKADVSISNGSSATPYNTGIVAQKVSFASSAYFKYDSTGTKTGLVTQSVALVQ